MSLDNYCDIPVQALPKHSLRLFIMIPLHTPSKKYSSRLKFFPLALNFLIFMIWFARDLKDPSQY